MSKILVVVSSARKGRVADSVLEQVNADFKSRDITPIVADLKEIDLPFFDSEHVPMSPEFNPTDERVIAWTNMVGDADGVLILMPEYNHSMNAILKNAIDWIYKEWNDKPLSIVGYGWSGASQALITAKTVLDNVKATQLPTTTNLHFMKHISPDGAILDTETAASQIKATVDELLAAVAK